MTRLTGESGPLVPSPSTASPLLVVWSHLSIRTYLELRAELHLHCFGSSLSGPMSSPNQIKSNQIRSP